MKIEDVSVFDMKDENGKIMDGVLAENKEQAIEFYSSYSGENIEDIICEKSQLSLNTTISCEESDGTITDIRLEDAINEMLAHPLGASVPDIIYSSEW